MPGQVFGGGVEHDVGAQVERLLQIRRDEGVVDDHDRAVPVRDARDCGDVVDLQQRIGQRLHVHGARGRRQVVAAHGPFERGFVLRVHGCAEQPPAPEVLVEQRIRAAVDVRADDDAVVGREDREHGMDRGEPGGECKAARAVFELGDLALQELAGRVAAARVIPAGHRLDRFESVCG